MYINRWINLLDDNTRNINPIVIKNNITINSSIKNLQITKENVNIKIINNNKKLVFSFSQKENQFILNDIKNLEVKL